MSTTPTRTGEPRPSWLYGCFHVLMLAALTPAILLGQAAGTGSITGHVTDETGAPVPAVSVTVTGPKLQVPAVTTVTNDTGDYQVLDLPSPGVYKIAFA